MSQNQDGRVLTCVYCGHEYPQDTPAWGNQVLTDHIKICEKHPMRKAEKTISELEVKLARYRLASQKLLRAAKDLNKYLPVESGNSKICNARRIIEQYEERLKKKD